MGLDEHPVDLFEIHDAGLVTHGLDERAETQVAGAAQQPFAGAHNEGQRFGRKGVVTQAGAIELIQDKLFHRFGGQFRVESQVTGDEYSTPL